MKLRHLVLLYFFLTLLLTSCVKKTNNATLNTQKQDNPLKHLGNLLTTEELNAIDKILQIPIGMGRVGKVWLDKPTPEFGMDERGIADFKNRLFQDYDFAYCSKEPEVWNLTAYHATSENHKDCDHLNVHNASVEFFFRNVNANGQICSGTYKHQEESGCVPRQIVRIWRFERVFFPAAIFISKSVFPNTATLYLREDSSRNRVYQGIIKQSIPESVAKIGNFSKNIVDLSSYWYQNQAKLELQQARKNVITSVSLVLSGMSIVGAIGGVAKAGIMSLAGLNLIWQSLVLAGDITSITVEYFHLKDTLEKLPDGHPSKNTLQKIIFISDNAWILGLTDLSANAVKGLAATYKGLARLNLLRNGNSIDGNTVQKLNALLSEKLQQLTQLSKKHATQATKGFHKLHHIAAKIASELQLLPAHLKQFAVQQKFGLAIIRQLSLASALSFSSNVWQKVALHLTDIAQLPITQVKILRFSLLKELIASGDINKPSIAFGKLSAWLRETTEMIRSQKSLGRPILQSADNHKVVRVPSPRAEYDITDVEKGLPKFGDDWEFFGDIDNKSAPNPIAEIADKKGKTIRVNARSEAWTVHQPLVQGSDGSYYFSLITPDGKKEKVFQAFPETWNPDQFALGYRGNFQAKEVSRAVAGFPIRTEVRPLENIERIDFSNLSDTLKENIVKNYSEMMAGVSTSAKNNAKATKNIQTAVSELINKDNITLKDLEKLNETITEGITLPELKGVSSGGVLRGTSKRVKDLNGQTVLLDVSFARVHGNNEFSFADSLKVPALAQKLVQRVSQMGKKNNFIDIMEIYRDCLIIHPFLDGNGRTCRSLAVLSMIKTGLINTKKAPLIPSTAINRAFDEVVLEVQNNFQNSFL